MPSKTRKEKKCLISGGENEATDVGKSTTPKKGLGEIGLWKGRFWCEGGRTFEAPMYGGSHDRRWRAFGPDPRRRGAGRSERILIDRRIRKDCLVFSLTLTSVWWQHKRIINRSDDRPRSNCNPCAYGISAGIARQLWISDVKTWRKQVKITRNQVKITRKHVKMSRKDAPLR